MIDPSACSSAQRPELWCQFTGKERDAETGLDFFLARYYSPAQGRFLSPDPLEWLRWQHRAKYDGDPTKELSDLNGAKAGRYGDGAKFTLHIADPQNLNLYAYVHNNPMRFTDPLGLEEGSAENLKKRALISKIAIKADGSADWAVSKKKDNMPAGSWKCSQFVNDTVKAAGAEAKFDGRGPLAGEWRNPKAQISDWRVLKQGESPQAGDVGAIKILDPGPGATGHSGIVVGDGSGGTTVMQAHEKVVSTENAAAFNPANSVTWRRYTGD
jgi:RHS repeat-associated protein